MPIKLGDHRCIVHQCRLQKSPTCASVVNERQLLHLYGGEHCIVENPFETGRVPTVDDVAVEILQRYHGAMLNRFQPLSVNGDGTAAFDLLRWPCSAMMFYVQYVRLLNALEVIDNPADYYDVASSNYCGLMRDNRIHTSSSFDILVRSVTSVVTAVELIHLYAISSAFDCLIQSYVPPTEVVGLGTSPYTVKIAARAFYVDVDAGMSPRRQ